MPVRPQRLFGEALLNSANRNPGKIALISRGVSYSYQDFRSSAEALASHLIRNGLQKGDRVAIQMHNSWQCAVSIYGVSLAGGVFLTLNVQTKAEKLAFILNDSGAVALISEYLLLGELEPALREAGTVQQLILSGDQKKEIRSFRGRKFHFEEVLTEMLPAPAFPNVIPTDLAALIYTSGSTGFPKGVMMTHQSMVFTSWSLIEYLRLDETDRIMLLLPMAFDYGLYQLIMSVTLGATVIVEYSFTFPASIYKSIEKHQPTVFPGVPTIYSMMIGSNKESGIRFECIRKVTNTAAALPMAFIPDMKKIFPNALIFSMYGLTECKRVSYLEPELIDSKPGSVGKAIPGTEVFLLSSEGQEVPAGQAGILHVRGPHVMQGYWKREELTRQMLIPGKLPGEKVLCSNDWFTMDEEGFLYFQGRNDDIIKTRGEKVSPLEVENAIFRHPAVKETVVLGLPDEMLGEAVIAYVTLYPGSIANEQEILRECKSRLELFMIPSRVIILDQMPKSANGKIDKKELKQAVLHYGLSVIN